MFSKEIKVYYEDTDIGGVVYYANYLKFMERVRTDFLSDLGFTQTQIKDDFNLLFVVRKVEIDYFNSAKFEDILECNAKLIKLSKVRFVVQQEIKRNKEVLTSAFVEVASINKDTMKATKMPDIIFNKLKESL